MENRKAEKCAHPNCSCIAEVGSKYCSGYCEAAKDKNEISCGCDHAQCAGKAA